MSHDCDIVASAELEPTVEVIIGREVDAADGKFANAKAARTLHLPFAGGEHAVVVELSAPLKRQIRKSALDQYQPATKVKISLDDRTTLRRWLASRYLRAVFADSFIDRMGRSGTDERFKKIIEKSQAHLAAIYFDVDGGQEIERMSDDDLHVLSIYLIHTVANDPEASRVVAEGVKAEIEKMFRERCKKDGRWTGIQLEGCYVHSKAAMNLDTADKLKKWNTDYLSMRAAPQGPMTTE